MSKLDDYLNARKAASEAAHKAGVHASRRPPVGDPGWQKYQDEVMRPLIDESHRLRRATETARLAWAEESRQADNP